MQLAGIIRPNEKLTFYQAVSNVVRNEGILAIYDGLSASILRQLTYTTTRLGTYNAIMGFVR